MEAHTTQVPSWSSAPSCLQPKQQRQGSRVALPSSKTRSEDSRLTQRQSLTQAINTSHANTGSQFTEGNGMNPGYLGWRMRKEHSTMIMTLKLEVIYV